MSFIKKLVGQTAIYGLSSMFARFLNYLLVPFYTRMFLPEQYGVVTELYSYSGFLMVLYSFGIETAFFRFYNLNNGNALLQKKVYEVANFFLVCSTIVLSVALVACSGFLSKAIGYSAQSYYVIWFVGILAFDTVSVLPFARLRQEGRATKFAFLKLCNILINILLNLFFIVYLPKVIQNPNDFFYNWGIQVGGISAIFVSNLVASAITFLLLLPQLQLPPKWNIDVSLLKKMLQYGLPLVVVGFAGIINEMLDRLLLKHLLPYSITENVYKLGIYGACYKLSMLATLFTQAFRLAAEPLFFSHANSADAPKRYAQVMDLFVAFQVFIFLCITLFINITKMLIGTAYHEGLFVVPILVMANVFLGIYYNLSVWYKLSNKTQAGALISVIGAFITIILNIFFIPIYGYAASAWATLICYISMVLISYVWGQKHYFVPYNVRLIVSYLVLGVIIFYFNEYVINNFSVLSWVYFCKIIVLLGFCIFVFFTQKSSLKH